MAKKRTKLSAKEVQKSARKSEETIKVPDQVMGWVQVRRQWFLAVGIGLLVGLVLVWGFSSYEQVRERRAQMQYAHTLSKLASKQGPDGQVWAPLIAELKSLCEQYRGTRAARTAQVDLAQAYFLTGQYDQAITWDLKNLHDQKADPAAQIFIRHRLAMSYRATNRLDEALTEATALEGLAVPGFKREVQWLLGQLFAAKDEPDKAVEHYRKALDVEGTFPADGIIQEGLTQALQKTSPKT